MADKRATEIITLRDSERKKQSNFRNLWQEVADLMFPRENQINDKMISGRDKTREIWDTTAIFDSQDMASGLSGAMIPTGQKFFNITLQDKDLAEEDSTSRYLSVATEITHESLFASNFMLQLNETLRSLVVFGTGNLYSEWDLGTGGLNFKDYDIGDYQIRESNKGRVDTIILTIDMTVRQALQEFGADNLADEMVKLKENPETVEKVFEFIHIIQPRSDRKPGMRDNLNMPFESIFIDVQHAKVVRESGFEENPFAVARWMKSSAEKYGRGQGTEALSEVKVLQQMKRDLVECGNKWNNPPREVLSSFEGQVNVTPGALNFVEQMGSIKGLDQMALGSFPITKEMLEFQRETIHTAFFRDIFVQLAGLRGDRRTTVEIIERIREGLRRLALPVARLQSELFTPVITRSVLLLIRNGRIPYPPEEMAGQAFGLEYEGELALALKNQEAKGFQQWAEFGGAMAELFPGVLDNVDSDKAFRRQGRAFGINAEDMATEEEVEARRLQRRQQQQQMELQLAEMAAKGYGQTNTAPEEGSPAKAVMEAVG